ncbi:hypothetical protein, partial [Acidiphilium sp.]|uniref:hypothetical protein n=1 Tax=Acidiphilium sp. TaxID=527 RepID=UPI0025894584
LRGYIFLVKKLKLYRLRVVRRDPASHIFSVFPMCRYSVPDLPMRLSLKCRQIVPDLPTTRPFLIGRDRSVPDVPNH